MFRKAWLADAHDDDRPRRPAEKQKDAMVAVSQTALRLTKADAKKFAEDLNELVEGGGSGGQAARQRAPTRCSG